MAWPYTFDSGNYQWEKDKGLWNVIEQIGAPGFRFQNPFGGSPGEPQQTPAGIPGTEGPPGHIKIAYNPETWWNPDTPDVAQMRDPWSGQLIEYSNFPAPDSKYQGPSQGGEWSPIVYTKSDDLLREIKRLQTGTVQAGNKGWKFLEEELRNNGLDDYAGFIGSADAWNGLPREEREDVLIKLADAIFEQKGLNPGTFKPRSDQEIANNRNLQKTMINKSPSDTGVEGVLNQFADTLKTSDPGSQEFNDALSNISNLMTATQGNAKTTDQYITQQLTIGTPESIQNATNVRNFLNQLTPYQISQINQAQANLAWEKNKSLFDRSMTRQQFDRLLETDIFNQDIASRQMTLSEQQQADLQTQRGVTNQLERDKFNLSDEQFELTYGLSKQQIDDLRAQRGVTNQLERDKFNLSDQQFQQTYGLSKQQLDDLNKQRGVENQLERDRLNMSDQQFQQTYGLSKNQFMAGEDQRSFENRFAQDQFNAQQEQLQFSNQQALTDQAFRATELGLDLLNSPGDLFTFLTRLRGEQGSLPFQQGGQAIPRTFPFTFNQAIPPQPFGLRDRDWAPPDYDWGPGGYQIPEVPGGIPPFPGDGTTGDGTQPPPSLQPPTAQPPLPPVTPTASDDAVRQIMRDQAAADDPVTWDVAREIANIEAQTTPTAMATPTSATVAPTSFMAPTSAIAPTLGAGATPPMGGTIAQAGMINPTAQTSPSQQLGFGGTGTRTVTPSGMPMTTLQPFGLPTSTVGPLPEQGLSQAFLGMPPTGRRTLASLGAPPALSYQSMSRLTPTERAIRLSEAKAQGFSEQDFLEEDIRHQMSPRTGGGRARFVPGRFRG